MPDSKVINTDELLLYLYDELDSERKTEVENCIESNWGIREKLNILKDSVKNMQSSLKLKSPRSKTINFLKEFAVKSIGVNTVPNYSSLPLHCPN
jgi:hypothetical protein